MHVCMYVCIRIRTKYVRTRYVHTYIHRAVYAELKCYKRAFSNRRAEKGEI